MTKRPWKRYSVSTSQSSGNANQGHKLTSVMITIKTKTKTKQVYGERGTLYTAVGNTTWCSHYRKQYEDSSEY